MQVRPYRDLNNFIDGAVITFTDISERKQHEQAHALLAAIVESSQDAIISHDLDGTITSWNAGAEQLYEYPTSEAIGQSLSILAEALPENWAALRARLEQGEQIAVTISPIRDADGRVAGASVVARNISERKAAEERAGLLLSENQHHPRNVRRRDRRPRPVDRQSAHPIVSSRAGGDGAARLDHDGIGALRPARGQPRHRRP
jgi:two-component system CheB/CheR fusion protein